MDLDSIAPLTLMPTIVASSSPPERPAARPRRTLGQLAVVVALLVLVALHARLYLTAVWSQSIQVEGTATTRWRTTR